MIATLWFATGHFLGGMDVVFSLMFGIPVWFCLFASFFHFRFTRSSIFGARSVIATSVAALAIWIGICVFIGLRHELLYRGADVGAGLVLLAISLAAAIILPLVAWCFSTPITGDDHGSKPSQTGG